MTDPTDKLARAVSIFEELCDLPEPELETRLGRLRRDAPDLADQVEELLLGDRAPDPRLDRAAEELVDWATGSGSVLARLASDDAGHAETAEASARLRERGRKIEHYRLGDEIARGGMGVILEAWDTDLDRRLAMKVAESGPAARPARTDRTQHRRLARFLDEARVAAQLDHPGIVPVHDVGIDEEGRAFFTMKLVKGRTLREVFDAVRGCEEGWTQTRALNVLLRVCEAMAYAHTKGVVHRDLKPENVMVGRFGEVYVMDWGVAWIRSRHDERDLRPRPVEADPEPSLATDEIQSGTPIVTMDGTIIGTPFYMSPEQAAGGRIDERSDVYALGAILYTLLAGRPPYQEADTPRAAPREVLARVVVGPPTPLARTGADVPAELEAICEKAMARRPEDRYANMLELAEDLRADLEGRVVRAHRTGAVAELRKWVRRNRALAGAIAAGFVVLCVGLGTSLALWREARASERVARVQTREAEAARGEAQDQRDEVLRLATFFRTDDLRRRADELWPLGPDQLEAYEDWIVTAEVLLSEQQRESSPARRLEELRASALPRTPEQKAADERTHASYSELTRLEASLARLRARSRPTSSVELPPETTSEGALELEARARPLVMPSRRDLGREAEGFALAEAALDLVQDDEEFVACLETFAWACFATGRDELALNRLDEAIDFLEVDQAQAVRRWRAEIQQAVERANERDEQQLIADLERLRGEVATRRTWRFSDPTDQLTHDYLEQVVQALGNFEASGAGFADADAVTRWSVRQRAEGVRKLAARTLEDPRARERWEAAIRTIEDPDRSPHYDGLRIAPQFGLLPLGPDPHSGLWEFAHPVSGEVPARDEDGELEWGEETCLIFVLIPGGTYLMGAQSQNPEAPGFDSDALVNEEPPHSVHVSPFFLSKYEVTQAQWVRVDGTNPSLYQSGSSMASSPTHPVERVSWLDCKRVCDRLGLSLPTEEQWEYAARGGQNTPWWTGANRESLRGHINIADASLNATTVRWPSIQDWPDFHDGFMAHAPTGTYPRNPFGLGEAQGNVWEWCLDAFGPYAGNRAVGADSVEGSDQESEVTLRTYRGGSFRNAARDARPARRNSDQWDARQSYLGFRPARELEP